MKKKKIYLLIFLTLLAGILLFSTIIFFNQKEKIVVGGDTDDHGCLVGAGYSWDAELGACTRSWEIKESDNLKAAKIAIAPLSFPVTIISVDHLDCEGCYRIMLQRNDNRENLEIQLRNWKFFEDLIKTYCKPEQRNAEICTMDYDPVCGWFDDSINCFKYPCASTYSNACEACIKEDVEYHTPGNCPE
ncbi:MAG: hypothetical protein WC867_01770 [Candidatus Pacearchaeota archaeon]|jgi:hypothetical protein